MAGWKDRELMMDRQDGRYQKTGDSKNPNEVDRQRDTLIIIKTKQKKIRLCL